MNKNVMYFATALGVVTGIYAIKKASDLGAVAAEVVTTDLNPASPDNIVNRGVSSVGEAVTGKQGWNLGGAIYDGVDLISGLWGGSDADRMEQIEAETRARLFEQKQQPDESNGYIRGNLMKWFKDRLKEKSTWRGLAILAGVCGVAVDPLQMEMIGSGVVGAIGLIETVAAEG